MAAWIFLLISLFFEVIGDIAVKQHWMVVSLISYNLMLLAWFKVVEAAGQKIAMPGLIWLLGCQVTVLLVGLWFGETLTTNQKIGAALSFVVIYLVM